MAAKLPFAFPMRQIHLDFHTGPQIPDVGANFDPKQFAQTMKDAQVNSVTLFAKCHHGHLYYNTKRPERHPGLKKGLDLVRQQVEALHRVGIRAPIYLSVLCDEYAATTHPEWIARESDSSLVKRSDPNNKAFTAGWQIMDMTSPYQEFLVEQTAEVLKLFQPADGIFFDMCWDQPSTNPYFLNAMRKEGLNPECAESRERFATVVAKRYMKRLYRQVKASSPDATVFFNCRPLFQLASDIEFMTQAEIEALPTGGWGYMYFPINMRFARTVSPKPVLGMTARFHKSWADFGGMKPHAALAYETASMIAHGAACSIGDQLHPRGVLDKAVYELIGHAYSHVAECEPWLVKAKPVTQIGLFQKPTGVTSTTQSTSQTDEGAVRMLTQLRHQFDVVQTGCDLSKYDLLIVPDGLALDAALAKELRTYIQAKGRVLFTGSSGLGTNGTGSFLRELGLTTSGESPYQATYMRFLGKYSNAAAPTDHIIYDRTVRVTAQRGTQVIAGVVEPYFDRTWDHFCSHNQTPGDKLSPYALGSVHGRVGHIAFNVFEAYAKHGNLPYRNLVKTVLDALLDTQLITVSGPSYLEATVTQQKQDRKQTLIVHLLGYQSERRAPRIDIIEDVVPLYDLDVVLQTPTQPKAVTVVPAGEPLAFTWKNGALAFTLPELKGHGMIAVTL
jgi:hypothetical protein